MADFLFYESLGVFSPFVLGQKVLRYWWGEKGNLFSLKLLLKGGRTLTFYALSMLALLSIGWPVAVVNLSRSM